MPKPTNEDDVKLEESNEIKYLKKQIAKLNRQLVERTTGDNLLIQAVEQVFERPIDLRVPPTPPRQRKKYEEVAVLHISDTQIGKVTATYDSTVAEERLMKLIDETIRETNNRRNSANISDIRVYLGGDIIEGEIIFPHQLATIDQSVLEQALVTAPSILARCILALMAEFTKVKVICVPGNHGRPSSKKSGYHPKSNWDSAVYKMLKTMLLGTEEHPHKDIAKRLEFFEKPGQFYAVDHIFNWGNLIVHGHQIRGGFAGFPWYGASKKAWGWIDSIPHPWDYLYFGHFHTPASAVLNHRMFLANGTTESDNSFAQEQLAATGWPCQRLSFYNEKVGLVATHPVILTDERKPSRQKALDWLHSLDE